MKETNYYCDDKNCKKQLDWGETYFIVSIKTHVPNMSYTTQEDKEKHFCADCFEKRY